MKMHTETRGNTRDRNRTCVHDHKCGKDTLCKVKIKVSIPFFKLIEAVTLNSSEKVSDNGKPNATQLYGSWLVQEACSMHDTQDTLQREFPIDPGSSRTPTRAKERTTFSTSTKRRGSQLEGKGQERCQEKARSSNQSNTPIELAPPIFNIFLWFLQPVCKAYKELSFNLEVSLFTWAGNETLLLAC